MRKVLVLILSLTMVLMSSCKTKTDISYKQSIEYVRDFSEGYAWVTIHDETVGSYGLYMACVNSNGNIVFDDRDGISDSNGERYYIAYTLFDKIPVDYTYTNQSEIQEFYQNNEKESWQFNDGHALVLCKKNRDNLTDTNDDFYLCMVDTNGIVKYVVDFSLKELSAEINTNRTYLTSYYNGYGTYYIRDEQHCVIINNEAGIIYEQDSKDEKECYPLRGGYFFTSSYEASFQESQRTSLLMNKNGEIMDSNTTEYKNLIPNNFWLNGEEYSVFLNDRVAISISKETGFSSSRFVTFYNMDQGKLCSIEYMPKEYLFNFANGNQKSVFLDNIGYNSDTAHYYKGTSYYELDEKGIEKTVFECGDYGKTICSGYKYSIIELEDGIYSLNIQSGKHFKLFDQYYDNIYHSYSNKNSRTINSQFGVLNGVAYVLMYGKDNDYYICISTVDGKIILQPEKYNGDIKDVGQDIGFLYNGNLYRNDGKIVKLDLTDEENDALGSSNRHFNDGWYNIGKNYISKDGTLMFLE